LRVRRRPGDDERVTEQLPTIADLAAELEPILERPENAHILSALIDRLDDIYRHARSDGRW